ncbi:hypothetical protein B0H19DRAFT_1271320 [Mycena capillaripes]|nr:hypothetical protein B0H19DRAFT_1271320 [Mycena capillaripes]
MAPRRRLRSSPLPSAVINKPPSASDKPGAFYDFELPQEGATKLGRSNAPRRRQKEWARKCRGQQQVWRGYWIVPYAAKFEALIHAHFKRAGAWISPTPCQYCGVKHLEKYSKRVCGGWTEIVKVVEYYLRRLGWPVIRVDM